MGKRNKGKKAQQSTTPSETTMDSENDTLMDDLLAHLDSQDATIQTESATILNEMNLNNQATQMEATGKQDAKSRFKARQARKAAQLAQSYAPDDPAVQERLEKEAKDEDAAIRKVCRDLSVEIFEINPDGHCLFSAVADQLLLLEVLPREKATYTNLRMAAANFIYSHPTDFIPFLPSAGAEDGEGALDAGFMNRQQFEGYCTMVRDTAVWGGEPEIVALSKAFNLPIHVVQGSQPFVVVHDPTGEQSHTHSKVGRVIRISYHRKLYGLGEHYNSLRPIYKISPT